MAQTAGEAGVGELPDQGIVLAHDARRAGPDAVRPVDVVSTLHTAVWALPGQRETFTRVSSSFRTYLL